MPNLCDPGGGCQFLGTAATSQVIGEALGYPSPTRLFPQRVSVWMELAKRSAKALHQLHRNKICTSEILTSKAIHNAMVTHAACGGSSNLILHLTAIAFHAGLSTTVKEWDKINRLVPGWSMYSPTARSGIQLLNSFSQGGAGIDDQLRELDLLELDALTCTGENLGKTWKYGKPVREETVPRNSWQQDQVNPDDVIHTRQGSIQRDDQYALLSLGNLAPEGSVIKSTSIDPRCWTKMESII